MSVKGVERARWALRRRIGWQPYSDADKVPCGLCGSRRGEIVGRRMQFAMRYASILCSDCGLVYTSPRPRARAYELFYQGPFQRLSGVEDGDAEPTERGLAVADFLAGATDLRSHTGLFDVGCGGGGLLRAIARDPRFSGLALAGCDPGWHGHTQLHDGDVRIDVYPRPVEELYNRLSAYSLFVLYDVVEHLLEPRKLLRALHDLASARAEIFVSTSCLDHWRDIPPAGWEAYYLRLAHPYTFTEKTLAAMLSCSGWQVTARRPAPKGDQWVIASRASPHPVAAQELGGHAEEVKAMIEAYRARAG